MKLPVILIRKSTQDILNANAEYPRADMSEPVVGLDPDLEYLIKHTPFPEPDYDSREYVLNVIETITQTPHPTFPHLNTYQKTYTTTKRPKSDIIAQIKNAQKLADAALYGTEDQLSFMFNVQSALNRKIEGLTLTTEEQDILNRHAAISAKIALNKNNYDNLVSVVDLDNIPNIDEGWEKSI